MADFDSGSNLKRDSAQINSARYYHPQQIGLSFQRLATDVVKGESTDVVSRWFRSQMGDADLVIWTDTDGRIIKHQLCLFGQISEWTPIQGTRTGYIFEEEHSSGEESEIIRFDPAPDHQAVKRAIEVITHIRDLVEAERSAMIYHLKQSPKLHKKARERALKTWSLKDSELTNEVRPSFWKKITGWLKKK